MWIHRDKGIQHITSPEEFVATRTSLLSAITEFGSGRWPPFALSTHKNLPELLTNSLVVEVGGPTLRSPLWLHATPMKPISDQKSPHEVLSSHLKRRTSTAGVPHPCRTPPSHLTKGTEPRKVRRQRASLARRVWGLKAACRTAAAWNVPTN